MIGTCITPDLRQWAVPCSRFLLCVHSDRKGAANQFHARHGYSCIIMFPPDVKDSSANSSNHQKNNSLQHKHFLLYT